MLVRLFCAPRLLRLPWSVSPGATAPVRLLVTPATACLRRCVVYCLHAEAARSNAGDDAAANKTTKTTTVSEQNVDSVLEGRWPTARVRERRLRRSGDIFTAVGPAVEDGDDDDKTENYNDYWMMESNSSFRSEEMPALVSEITASNQCLEKLCECVNVGTKSHTACSCVDPNVNCWYTGVECFCQLDKHITCTRLKSDNQPSACPIPGRSAVLRPRGSGAKYCDRRVCLSVRLSVCMS